MEEYEREVDGALLKTLASSEGGFTGVSDGVVTLALRREGGPVPNGVESTSQSDRGSGCQHLQSEIQ